ncbi:hypothetical protein STEG23_012543, partial [Scotinomys teguina]
GKEVGCALRRERLQWRLPVLPRERSAGTVGTVLYGSSQIECYLPLPNGSGMKVLMSSWDQTDTEITRKLSMQKHEP